MRSLTPIFAVALAVLAVFACTNTGPSHPPPMDRFYWPTGLAFTRPPGTAGNGVLYVASANWDKRYDTGTLMAVELDRVRAVYPDGGQSGQGLPPVGAPVGAAVGAAPVELHALNLGDRAFTTIAAFAGRVGTFPVGDGGVRLFIPTRAEYSEPNLIQAIDAYRGDLTCYFAPQGRDCRVGATNVSSRQQNLSSKGYPAALDPFSVGIASSGDLYVASLTPAHSPPGSAYLPQAYVVHYNANDPPKGAAPESAFLALDGGVGSGLPGDTGTYDVAVGSRYAFLSGYALQAVLTDTNNNGIPNIESDVLVRTLDRTSNGLGAQPFLRNDFHASSAPGILLSADEQRLYVLTRLPDELLVVALTGATTSTPTFTIERTVPLPAGATAEMFVPRNNAGDLIAIVSNAAGSLVFYDQDVGALVGRIGTVAQDPFAIAVDSEPVFNRARLYISDMGNGQISVVDVPNLSQPQTARLVAHLGRPQTCLVQPADPSCANGEQP